MSHHELGQETTVRRKRELSTSLSEYYEAAFLILLPDLIDKDFNEAVFFFLNLIKNKDRNS